MTALPAGLQVLVNFEGVIDPTTMIFDDADSGRFGTGTFGGEAAFVDVTEYVRAGSIRRGVFRADSIYGRAEAGTAEVVLGNLDARFDPTNLDGPYVAAGASQVKPMRAWRIRAGGVDLWRGFADSWTISYPAGGHDAVCALRGTDGTKVLANFDGPEQGSQGAGEDTGARIGRILDSAGWAAEDRVLATGQTTVQATTLAAPAWSEILLTADTEIGEVYFDGAGRIVFRDRHALWTDARSRTSQATFGDGPGELGYTDLDLAHDDAQIANLARIARVGGVEQIAEDLVSQVEYLTRTFERSDLIHQTDEESADYAGLVIGVLADGELRFDSITVDPRRDPDALYPQVLGRELGDRIMVRRRAPGRESDPIEREVWIRGIAHSFGPDLWVTEWTLQDAGRFNFFVLDDAALGQLDDDLLGY